MKTIILFLLLALVQNIYGQNREAADEKIAQVEAFKKYKTMRLTNDDYPYTEDGGRLKMVEIINYLPKNLKSRPSKITMLLENDDLKLNRTYYFNENGKIFAITEVFKENMVQTEKLIYYFEKGELYKVFNSKNENITTSTDSQTLRRDIIALFDDSCL